MICGFIRKIWALMIFLRKMYSIQKVGVPSIAIVKHWFQEWNTRGKVVVWEIKQFFHKENQTIVEWYFKNGMNNGDIEEFDGISLIEWTEDNKIKSLKEFGCNRNTYNPYQESDTPQFRNQKANWF